MVLQRTLWERAGGLEQGIDEFLFRSFSVCDCVYPPVNFYLLSPSLGSLA
jgi:hypothetical protein